MSAAINLNHIYGIKGPFEFIPYLKILMIDDFKWFHRTICTLVSTRYFRTFIIATHHDSRIMFLDKSFGRVR